MKIKFCLCPLLAACFLATPVEGAPCPYLQKSKGDAEQHDRGSTRSLHYLPHRHLEVRSLQSPPTTSVEAIKEAITNARIDIGWLCNADMSPKFVRLAFHDCIGGCDGCLNLSNPENFGLDTPIDALAPIVSKYSGVLTRADIWVLAGMVAAESTQVRNPKASFEMQYASRPVCAEDDPKGGPERHFPSSHSVTAELLDYFAETFPGFTTRDTVALIGAHTLGVATKENSGYDGPDGWVINKSRLDNEFYSVLISNGFVDDIWRPEMQDNIGTIFPDQIIWRMGESVLFMLNSDMALVVDFANSIDPMSGLVSCNLSGENVCPAASTLGIANEYANSHSVWLSDFHDAFIKMTNAGCEDGSSCLDLVSTAQPSTSPTALPTDPPTDRPTIPSSAPVVPRSGPFSWIEDFDSLSNGTQSNAGATAWSLTRTGGIFEVRDGALVLNDGGSEGVLTTDAIDISGAASVEVSLDVLSVGKLETTQDYVKLYAKVDGSSEVLLGEKWGNQDPGAKLTSSVTGNSLVLVIRAYVSYNDEFYIMDNLSVTSTS